MTIANHTFIVTWNIDEDGLSVASIRKDIRRLHTLEETSDMRHSLLRPYKPRIVGKKLMASITDWQKASKGDRVYIYLTSGKESVTNRIIGSGFLISDPYMDGRWAKQENESPYTVDIEPDVLLNPLHELELLMQPTLELQFPDYDWSEKMTDLLLDEETAYLLEDKWYTYLSTESSQLPKKDFWCLSRNGFKDMYSWKTKQGNYDMGLAMLYLTNLKAERRIAKLCL